jgi:gamma-glutamyltranspeptidase/glutathione hydrolase
MSDFATIEARGGQAVVSSGTARASSAAEQVLRDGGNVVDAALAASAVLCVVLPHAVALGGDLFALVRTARDGSVIAVNATGGAPGEADIAAYHARGLRHVPLLGPLSIQPPGLVAGWQALHDRWGSLPLARLLAPAIDLAQDGFAAGARLARFCRELSADLLPIAGWADLFAPGGTLLAEGARFRQERLAATLRRIAERGAAGFYEGAVADDLVATVRDAGGLLSHDDLRRVAVDLAPPLQIASRGLTIYSQPPISQGVVLLRALRLLDRFVAAHSVDDAPKLLSLAASALRQAFAERLALLGDDADGRVRAEAMLDDQIIPLPDRPALAHDGRETTTLVVGDRHGNTAALIQSVFADFGSGVVGRESGVLLNNRLSAFFLDPFHPNGLQPHRRTMHTLHNFIAVDADGTMRFAGGSPGGDNQPQVNLLFLLRTMLLGETPSEAIAAPRFAVWPGTYPTDAAHGVGTVVKCEPTMPDAVRVAFTQAGFSVAEDASIGSLKLSGTDADGLVAWADTRREAAVAAL